MAFRLGSLWLKYSCIYVVRLSSGYKWLLGWVVCG